MLHFPYLTPDFPYRRLLQICIIRLNPYLPPPGIRSVIKPKQALGKGYDYMLLALVQAEIEAGDEFMAVEDFGV